MRNKNGFTLMEVIVAIAVVAIISGPLLQVFITSNRVGRNSYNVDQANAVAVKTVEEIIQGTTDRAINSFNYVEDESGGVVRYTATDYYDYGWGDLVNSDGATFSAQITLSGENASSEAPTYIPALNDENGNSYWIDADYENMGTATYYLVVSYHDATDSYTVECTSAPVLKNTSDTEYPSFASTVTLPGSDFNADVIPIVIDVGSAPADYVTFSVDNQTAMEVGFYIYGDYGNDPHYVTAEVTSGSMSTNYMKVTSNGQTYDFLDANVTVARIENGDVLADYTTKLYFPR